MIQESDSDYFACKRPQLVADTMTFISSCVAYELSEYERTNATGLCLPHRALASACCTHYTGHVILGISPARFSSRTLSQYRPHPVHPSSLLSLSNILEMSWGPHCLLVIAVLPGLR